MKKIKTNIKKSGYGDGETVASRAKKSANNQINGLTGSKKSKPTLTGAKKFGEKGGGMRSTTFQPKSTSVKAKSDPTGTSHHPDLPNIFKNIRSKQGK